ncbi:MAG: DUF3570 domain-containing protein [Steroidobacteraceae bacterium]
MADDSLNTALAAATCVLLSGSMPALAADESNRWSFDSALMYYGESDSRVKDASATVAARRDFGDERSLGVTVTADTLTGASPSGAIALDRPQTFTSPSGRDVYSTKTGDIPLDDTFHDTRFALNAGWTQPFSRLYKLDVGLGFSTEYDYTHLGANVGVARDFNKRNTTVSAGVAWSKDKIDPEGGAPVPLSQMADVGDDANKRGSDDKDVLDVLVGFTQVLNRSTVLRVNYSYSKWSGYLNDPYKILSVVDPTTGDTLARSPLGQGPTGVYLYENRPDNRTKQSVYAEMKHAFGSPVLSLSYRFMTDDWEIDSHTVEARLRWPIRETSFIEPQLRYYTQSEAEFYRSSLAAGQPLPKFASSDFRLGNFDGTTVGLKFGHRLAGGNEWSVRLEYYQQSGHVPSDQLI